MRAIDHKSLTWDASRKFLIAECSDLYETYPEAKVAWPHQINVQGKTRIVTFRPHDAIRNLENEIVVVVYKTHDTSGVELHILND